MMKSFVFAIFSLAICLDHLSAANSLCGDWIAYKDESCYNVFDKVGLKTFENAEQICKENEAHLVAIVSKEEQAFVSNLLFTKNSITENVWLGARNDKADNKFKWKDGQKLSYSNWAPGAPSKEPTDDNCVFMLVNPTIQGKWADESCTKVNAVICKKRQTWSLAKLQEFVLLTKSNLEEAISSAKSNLKEEISTTKSNLEETISSAKSNLKEEISTTKSNLEEAISSAKSSISQLCRNSIPIGFIYTQLPSQSEPKTIWPEATWTDVTTDYAGVFFRAEGGGSNPFGGLTQDDNTRRLTEVMGYHQYHSEDDHDISVDKGWSNIIYTGNGGGPGNEYFLRFHISEGEVRPKNMAVRIWKRTG